MIWATDTTYTYIHAYDLHRMSTSKLGMLRVTIPGLLVLLLCEAVEKFQHIMILIYNQDLFYCEREKRLV